MRKTESALAVLLVLSCAPGAWAQDPPAPVPDPAPAEAPAPAPFQAPAQAPGLAPTNVPEPSADKGDAAGKDKDADKDQVKDGVRVRGGFGLGGGVIVTTADGLLGPVVALQARIGVQINHIFGIVYSNTPQLILTTKSGLTAGFVDWNTIMPTITLGHFFEVGGGPSFDFNYIATCSASLAGVGCEPSSAFAFGVHERLAFLIGGLSGNGPRRSGFQIGIDAHQAFGTDGVVPITLIGQIGAEWY